jgi:hypothetical protein
MNKELLEALESLGWATSGQRVDGAWYWVTNGTDVWPAIAYKPAAGGWANEDTWEDFEGKVVAWQMIPVPAIPGKA